jgi:nicotinamidase-related amidase
MPFEPLALRSQEFLKFLDTWQSELKPLRWVEAAPDPARTAIISVDVLKGFCTFGPLASERVNIIVEPIVALFKLAWARGLRQIVLVQDTHEPDAVEFGAWPPHCVRGSAEAEPVEEFAALPFFGQLQQVPKNSISSGLNTEFNAWISAHPAVDTFIVVGDCTDLCTYQLAMHLRLEANARQLQRRVIVPTDCVETYDRAVVIAAQQGGLPHDAELLNVVFLYHMALNGVDVVQKIV